MATIKMFQGTTPPLLKTGEWASDGYYAYLGMEQGQYKVFQGVFDMSKDQKITGFVYDLDLKAIIIPSGTPFTKLQRLFDTLPKALKYYTNEKASIDILFEDGNYINDLGTWLVLRDFSYQINIRSKSDTVDGTVGTYDKPVIFQSDKAIEIYNSAVNFSDIRFEYTDAQKGAIAFLNSTTNIDDCCFDAKVNQACITDKGYNKIVLSDAYFKLNRDVQDTLLDKASVGSFINIARSKSAPDFRPKSIVKLLSGGLIIAGNVEDLLIAEKSPVYLPHGGVEIHGGFVTKVDGNIDIAIPTKLSQLENDINLTSDYEQLENKPTTITPEQAEAIEANSEKVSYPQEAAEKLANIPANLGELLGTLSGADIQSLGFNTENATLTITLKNNDELSQQLTIPMPQEFIDAVAANTEKRSYPEADEEKLATIEERATLGADWETNIQNKPVTITGEQALAIEANSLKRSYPETDQEKLATIEEGATVGADWDTNVQNKPVTITEEQAVAIETNTEKRSYSEADEEKLATIEEGATVGADWEVNVSNKPTTISEEQADAITANTAKRTYPEEDEQKLAGIEEGATLGADWETNIQNKPVTITGEQALAIEANTEKRSYPEEDEEKLDTIEEGATVGADWETNVQNKPVTITEEQAAAIEVNSEKRSYPQADEEKLDGVPDDLTTQLGALNGADIESINFDSDGNILKLTLKNGNKLEIGIPVSSGVNAGGTDGQVQVNNGGAFSGSPFSYDDSTGTFVFNAAPEGVQATDAILTFGRKAGQDYHDRCSLLKFINDISGSLGCEFGIDIADNGVLIYADAKGYSGTIILGTKDYEGNTQYALAINNGLAGIRIGSPYFPDGAKDGQLRVNNRKFQIYGDGAWRDIVSW